MSAPTHRQLAMRKKLLDMAAQWDGVDQFNMGELEDLADRCETVATELIDDDAPEVR